MKKQIAERIHTFKSRQQDRFLKRQSPARNSVSTMEEVKLLTNEFLLEMETMGFGEGFFSQSVPNFRANQNPTHPTYNSGNSFDRAAAKAT